jgi:hypothetical protein
MQRKVRTTLVITLLAALLAIAYAWVASNTLELRGIYVSDHPIRLTVTGGAPWNRTVYWEEPNTFKVKTENLANKEYKCRTYIKIWAEVPLTNPGILTIHYKDSNWEGDIPLESDGTNLWAYIPSKTGNWTATIGYVNEAEITVTFHVGAPVCYYAADIWVEVLPPTS